MKAFEEWKKSQIDIGLYIDEEEGWRAALGSVLAMKLDHPSAWEIFREIEKELES